MCIPRDNGFEAWRNLCMRYEPQTGIRRMKEIAELTLLQNKRCKNAAETNLIVLEVDRRKRIIEEFGGQIPSNDILVSVLWCAMDADTRNHVPRKLDVADVVYCDLKQAVCLHTNLVGATSTRSPTAMDIGSIATVVVVDGVEVVAQPPAPQAAPHPEQKATEHLCSVDAEGWPIDVEGWHIEGYFDHKH